MFWLLVGLLILACVIYGVLRLKNIKIFKEGQENKGILLRIIVVTNIVITCLLYFILPYDDYFNFFGVMLFVFINILALIFNKKIAGNYIIFSIIVILYIVVMLILPIYKFEDYDGGYYSKNYYNCYHLRIFREIELDKEYDDLK